MVLESSGTGDIETSSSGGIKRGEEFVQLDRRKVHMLSDVFSEGCRMGTVRKGPSLQRHSKLTLTLQTSR